MTMLARICALITALVLSACGGGGGDAGTPSLGGGGAATLFTSATATVNLEVGRAGEYSISGGKAPYTISSSDLAVASVGLQGTAGFVISGVKGGSATVTVKDAAGTAVSIAVTVGSSTPLFSSAPSSISVQPQASQTYLISGGATPYAVSSADISVASAALTDSGLSFTVTGQKTGATRVVLTDAKGVSVVVSVAVTQASAAVPLTVSPAAVTAFVGDNLNFVVQGGTPGTAGYSTSVVNQGVATASSTGANTFRINLARAGQTAVTVTDSLGQVQTVSVTAQAVPAAALFTSAPAAVVFTNGVEQSFIVGGGSGAYAFQSSNLAVATVGPPGNSLVVTPRGVGTTTISVSDGTGARVSFTATVQAAIPLATSAASAGVTLAPSNTPTDYDIIGGITAYAVSSSNRAVATAQVTGASSNVLSITPVAAGSATVVVTDSAGTQVQVPVTVSPTGVRALSVTPESAGGTVGDVLTFTVGGGTPAGGDYTVRSNNTSIATVPATASSTFSATLVNAGTTVISVFDAQGQIQNVTLNVTSAATAIRVSPSAVLLGERLDLGPNLDPNNISLSVIGGAIAGNARAFSSDLTRITPVASGRTIRLFQGIQGTLCFVPGTDTSAATVTDLPVVITVVDDQGSSATMTVTIRNESTCP